MTGVLGDLGTTLYAGLILVVSVSGLLLLANGFWTFRGGHTARHFLGYIAVLAIGGVVCTAGTILAVAVLWSKLTPLFTIAWR